MMFHVFLMFPRAAEREQRRKRCVERVADLFDGGCGRGLGGHAVLATSELTTRQRCPGREIVGGRVQERDGKIAGGCGA